MNCGECQSKEGLSKRQIVIWNSMTSMVHVGNIEQALTYLLITNLIQIQITDLKCQTTLCQQCQCKIPQISYKIQIAAHNRESQLSFFKYCILVLDSSTGAYKKTLGTNQRQVFLKGNLVAKHLAMCSQKKLKHSHYQNIISQQKTLKYRYTLNKKQSYSSINPCEQLKQQNKSELFHLRQSLPLSQVHPPQNTNQKLLWKQKQSVQNVPKWKPSMKEEQKNSQITEENSKRREIKQYNLYVIKMQKQIENLYRAHMLHEYGWQEQEIDFVMKQVSLYFGDYQTIQQKRRYMHFTFKKESQSADFQEKWNNLSRQILLRKHKIVEGNIINYYIFSKEQILSNYFLTNKLFLLPQTSPIIDLCLADPWVAIAAKNYILFIHAYQPMDYFQHQNKFAPLKLSLHKKDTTLLIILHKQGISCYKLFEKVIELHFICQTSFLEPHTIQYMGNSVLLAGIDCQQKQSKRGTKVKRMIYKIEDKFINAKGETVASKSVKAQLQSQIEVLSIQYNKKHVPLDNLAVVPNKEEALACTFMNKFLLFSKQGHKLVEVQLKSTITKALFLPFMFNLFNFLVLSQNKQAVRIGVESYGGTLGAELQKLNLQKVRDIDLSLRRNTKYDLLVISNEVIIESNYLKEQNEEIIRQQKGKIVLLSSDQIGIAYLIDLQHSFELKYLEI